MRYFFLLHLFFLGHSFKQNGFYIEIGVGNGKELSNDQYKDAPDNLKLIYLTKMVENGRGLTDYQYNNTPDNLKLIYLTKMVKNGKELDYNQNKDLEKLKNEQ